MDKLLAGEPEYPDPDIEYTYRPTAAEKTRLSLRALIFNHWQLGVLAAVLVTIVAVANQAGPKLIDIGITDGMEAHKRFGLVVVVAAIFLGAILLSSVAQRMQTEVTGRLAAVVMHDLRVRVFMHLQRLGLDFYTEEKAGVVMTRMTSDIENLQQLLQDGLASFAVQGLTMIVITIIMFTLDVRLALITLLLVVPALTARVPVVPRRLRARLRTGSATGSRTSWLTSPRAFTGCGRSQPTTGSATTSSITETSSATTGRPTTTRPRSTRSTGRAPNCWGISGRPPFWVSAATWSSTTPLSVGALIAFFLYLNRFFAPIQLLVQQYNTFQQGQASILKLRTLFDTAPSVDEDPDATELPPIEGEILFDHVTFGYDPATPVIVDVNLRIAAGETVAFVGQTGAGKSTMAKLVTRFYDPTSGRVLIDGHDIKHVKIDSLRRQLGVVPQEPFLFAGTLRYNIAFACPDASDDEVWEAIREVGLSEVVERMPDGLDTIVHERGQSLSSGERQLIALARAFLAHPRVLVLDEATSNLDLASETKIEAALDVLLEERTAILIAHRLTTAMKADRIVVVDDGRIVETGSHDELVALGGRYAEMYETWMSHTDSEAA